MRKQTSSQVAAALGVSTSTIGYHARRGELPFDTTPGGHRRYDIDEVRRVLAERPNTTDLESNPQWGEPLAFSAEYADAQLTDAAALEIAVMAGADEQRFDRPAERLPTDPMEIFARPDVVRYPTSAHGVGASA